MVYWINKIVLKILYLVANFGLEILCGIETFGIW